jgi:hypothetical protein
VLKVVAIIAIIAIAIVTVAVAQGSEIDEIDLTRGKRRWSIAHAHGQRTLECELLVVFSEVNRCSGSATGFRATCLLPLFFPCLTRRFRHFCTARTRIVREEETHQLTLLNASR